MRAIRERAEELEEMALDVAEEAQIGAELWAQAAKKQRDEKEEREVDRLDRLDRRVTEKSEKSARFQPFGRPWMPPVTHKRRQSGLSSAEFNRWR